MNFLHLKSQVRALFLSLVGLVPVLAAAAPLYSVTTLGTTGYYSYGYGINDAGDVTGVNVTGDLGMNGTYHAFVSSKGVMTDIGTLGGKKSFPTSINNAGQVVGHSSLAGDTESSIFIYSNGTMAILGSLGGASGTATGINASGQVTGYDYTPTNAIHAFLYTDGTMKDLGTLGSYSGGYSTAYGINDAGQVVGSAYTNTFSSHAFLYSNGIMTDLGFLGPTDAYSSTAYAINNAGQVVGAAYTPQGYRAFLYENGVMRDLGTLGAPAGWIGGSDSNAIDINDAGEIIGYTDTPTAFHQPFLYTGGKMLEVNELIDSASGWRISDVTGINNNGQIVANACNQIGCQAVRLDLVEPVSIPEPGSLPLLAGGILLLRCSLRRSAGFANLQPHAGGGAKVNDRIDNPLFNHDNGACKDG